MTLLLLHCEHASLLCYSSSISLFCWKLCCKYGEGCADVSCCCCSGACAIVQDEFTTIMNSKWQTAYLWWPISTAVVRLQLSEPMLRACRSVLFGISLCSNIHKEPGVDYVLTRSLSLRLSLCSSSDLGLPYPKQMDRAVPANMVCGYHETP